jgi:sterol desaturase/sphingolipid hydroxylase (fatty acid hydroxylase superfamily)
VRPATLAFDLLGAPAIASAAGASLAAETVAPLRRRTASRRRRWRANLTIGLLAGAIVRAAVLPAALAVARRARGRGLLALLPRPIRSLAGLVLLDGAIWAWHHLNHRVPLLWRFHAPHHTDPDLDVTTALRFHPVELVLSIGARAIPIAILGAGPGLVILHEVLLQAATAFHHANLALPPALDRALTAVIVTPRMHGIHHSDRARDLDSNWGVVLSLWDRMAGTLRLDVPQDAIRIGIPDGPSAAQATHVPSVLAAVRRPPPSTNHA